MELPFIFLIGLGVLTLIAIIFFFSTYTVVSPSESHIVVFMGSGRKVYMPRQDEDGKNHPTAYFFIPFLMKRAILPLANIKMDIPAFELRDKNVAPFVCEVICWLRIKKPEVAIEKLDIWGSGSFEEAVRDTLTQQVNAIARAAAMKLELLDIMRERKAFGTNVEEEVNGALDEWGLQLVKLEVIDFSDAEGSEVINNYEQKREAEISTESRKVIADQNKDAEIVEANAKQLAGVRRAEAEREVEKANVDKTKQVEIAKQKAEAEISAEKEKANMREIEAQRKLDVGQAAVKKEALIEAAEGEAQAVIKVGNAKADVVKATGEAEGSAIKAKGIAEAESKEKMAEASNKFDKEQGLAVEQIRAAVEIEKAKYGAMATALSTAKINANVVAGGDKPASLLDLFGGSGGANLAQMFQAFTSVMGEDDKDGKPNNIPALVKKLAEVAKEATGKEDKNGKS